MDFEFCPSGNLTPPGKNKCSSRRWFPLYGSYYKLKYKARQKLNLCATKITLAQFSTLCGFVFRHHIYHRSHVSEGSNSSFFDFLLIKLSVGYRTFSHGDIIFFIPKNSPRSQQYIDLYLFAIYIPFFFCHLASPLHSQLTLKLSLRLILESTPDFVSTLFCMRTQGVSLDRNCSKSSELSQYVL